MKNREKKCISFWRDNNLAVKIDVDVLFCRKSVPQFYL